MKVVDSRGKAAPSWLVRMLCEGDGVAEQFWFDRRYDYRIVPC